MKSNAGFGREGMDATENEIDFLVWASSIPPTFHDAGVVTEEVEMRWFVAWCRDEGTSKKFEANGLGPANVPELRFPPVDKAPRSPARADDDGNANAGAGVRVSCNVDDLKLN